MALRSACVAGVRHGVTSPATAALECGKVTAMMRMFPPLIVLPILSLIWLLSAASAQACRMALVLGFDVSQSVNAQDYRLQVDGIVAALQDSEVRGLLLDAPDPVAVTIFEWAGQYEQRLVADWTILDRPATIDHLVQSVLAHQRGGYGLTAVGSALLYAQDLLDRAPRCLWQTIDLAGDGAQNNGPQPRRLYDTTDFGGIVVNGLAIGEHEEGIEAWFRHNVLHGPGAFVEFSATYQDFADAFRRKLIRELTVLLLSEVDTRHRAPTAAWPN